MSEFDLAKAGATVQTMFSEGKSDEEIADALGVNEQKVNFLRQLLGLRRSNAVNIFEETKILSETKYGKFISFSINLDALKNLSMNPQKKYNAKASVLGKNKIALTFALEE